MVVLDKPTIDVAVIKGCVEDALKQQNVAEREEDEEHKKRACSVGLGLVESLSPESEARKVDKINCV